MNLLLENGVDPNLKNDKGDTPLHKAKGSNCEVTRGLLIYYGADMTLLNDFNQKAMRLKDHEYDEIKFFYDVIKKLKK